MKAKQFYSSMAWRYFSRTILLYYSKKINGDLMVQCSTSGRWYYLNDKNIHVGHYLKVYDSNITNFATAFHELNVAPQCYQDNTFKGGKPDIMRKWLVKKYGEELIQSVEIQSKNIAKLGKFELDIIKEQYKEKFEKLCEIKGNPWKK